MTPSLQVTFTPAAQAVLDRFQTLPQRVLVAIKRGMDYENQHTVAIIQRDFLSFPKQSPPTRDGLRVITNRLRGSVRATKAVISGSAVTASIGSNVQYAAAHEFGFSGRVNVPQHQRKIIVGTAIAFTKSGRKKRIQVGGTTTVRAHTRELNLPARRPFLRGIMRNRDALVATVSQRIVEAATKS